MKLTTHPLVTRCAAALIALPLLAGVAIAGEFPFASDYGSGWTKTGASGRVYAWRVGGC
jgi:hypothetical protein